MHKTKAQLMCELAQARQRVAELEARGARHERMMKALRESEEHLRMLLDSTPAGVVVIDGETHLIIDVNRAASEMIGAPKEQIIGSVCHGHICPREKRRCPITDLGRTADSSECVLLRADGAIVPILKTVTSVTLDGQRRLCESFIDISDLKQTKEALWKSEQEYRALVEESRDGVYAVTRGGKLADANQSLAEMFGYANRQDIIGLDVERMYAHPDDRPKFRRVIDELGAVKDYEIELRRKDGSEMLCLVTASVRRANDGTILGYRGTLRNVTEQKRSEDELRKAHREMERLISLMPSILISVSVDDRIIRWNRAAATILGVSAAEAVGRMLGECGTLWDIDEVIKGLVACRITRQPIKLDKVRFTRPDGSEGLLGLTMIPIADEEGWLTEVLVLGADITERRILENQLAQAQKLESIGQLVAGIAHDFSNTLMAIMLYAEMLLDEPSLPPDLVSDVKEILDEARESSNLVRQILDFGRRSPLETQLVDLELLVQASLDVFQRTLPETIRLLFDVEPGEYVVDADPTRIQQMLVNLVVNARDAMPGGGELRIGLSRVMVGSGKEPPVVEMPAGEWACLSISDTGTGMPADVLSHLFEPFFTTKPKGEGTGLGLAQVYGILKQHGGYIDVQTKVGRGSTFRIYLPIQMGLVTEQAPQQETVVVPSGQGETILVAEDAKNILQLCQKVLESWGYKVLTAENGREALDVYLSAGGIDLLLTDMAMPEMSGKELIRRLRGMKPDLKVVIMTGYALPEDLNGPGKEQSLEVIDKPLDVNVLTQTIRRSLDTD